MPHPWVTNVAFKNNLIVLTIVVDGYEPGETLEISGQATQNSGAFATFSEIQDVPEYDPDGTAYMYVTASPSQDFTKGFSVTVVVRAATAWVTVLAPSEGQDESAEEDTAWTTVTQAAGLTAPRAAGRGESLHSVVDASVRTAVKEALSGPTLVDFEGWLGVEITDADGERVTVTEDREVPLHPGRRYTLSAEIATERPSGIASPLRITEGTKAATAEFSVLLDSDDPELRQPAQILKVRTKGGRARARFTFQPRETVPPPWLWLRVAQRERVVQNFELIGISADPEGEA